MLENTPENLAQWLRDPGAVKPGNYMATQIGPGAGLQLEEAQITELVDYLFSMQPEGGCTAPDGWAGGGAGAATPAATPVPGS
jgi:cytochrome c1